MSQSSNTGRVNFVLATHDEKVLDLQCDEVSLPGRLGEFGILPGHMPLLSTLSVGELKYRVGSETKSYAISWGFAEVADDAVTVLVEFAEAPADIDTAAAKAASESAYGVLTSGGLEEVKAALGELELASTRLRVAQDS